GRWGVVVVPGTSAGRLGAAHRDVGVGFARPQGHHDRVGLARERRAVLVDGLPTRIEGGPAGDLFSREPEDPLGADVGRLKPAVGIHENNALRQCRHDRAVTLLARPKRVLGAAAGAAASAGGRTPLAAILPLTAHYSHHHL